MPNVYNPATGKIEFVPNQAPVSTKNQGGLAAMDPYLQIQQQQQQLIQPPVDPLTGQHHHPEQAYQQHQNAVQGHDAQLQNAAPPAHPAPPTSGQGVLDLLPPLPEGQAYLYHVTCRGGSVNFGQSVGMIRFDHNGLAVVSPDIANYCKTNFPNDYQVKYGGKVSPPEPQVTLSLPMFTKEGEAPPIPIDEEEGLKTKVRVLKDQLEEKESHLLDFQSQMDDKENEVNAMRALLNDSILPQEGHKYAPAHRDLAKQFFKEEGELNPADLVTDLKKVWPGLEFSVTKPNPKAKTRATKAKK